VNLHFIRTALAAFPQLGSGRVLGQADLATKAAVYLTECGAYSAAVEFLLLDMADAWTTNTADIRRDEVAFRFPAGSSWKRQVCPFFYLFIYHWLITESLRVCSRPPSFWVENRRTPPTQSWNRSC
jgi:hypothetical protein